MENLPPPKPLLLSAGNISENFKKFEQTFNIYRHATGLSEKPAKTQASVLLHVAGEEALKVFNGFNWEEGESKEDPEVLLAKFKYHCTPITNVIYERHVFHTRQQQDGEPFDQFYSDLCNLVKLCSYGTLADEMVRDRIVSGIRSDALRVRMLRDPKLTLSDAVTLCRATELSQRQAKDISSQSENKVQYVKKKHHKEQKTKKKESCYCCGGPQHPRSQCPAKDATCNDCGRKGHFKSVCRTGKKKKAIHEVVEDFEDQEYDMVNLGTNFIGAVYSGNGKKWYEEISVDSTSLSFKIDTGADVNTISDRTYYKHFQHKILLAPDGKFTGATNQTLSCIGSFVADLQRHETKLKARIHVLVNGNNLIGAESSENLGLVKRLNQVENFPELFTGLGTMAEEYKIRLQDDHKPFAIQFPRRVAVPLMPKVKDELQRLESLGVIRRVERPTEWCAAMVVVPKAEGKVRICVDYSKLNLAVRRERHMLPSVDEALARMAGATVFSKLDANNGFHQVKLHKESQLLTTFMTPFGRFCYQRLPFGINSGPEHFQRQVHRVLENAEGVVCLMDDILVCGQTQEEHDHRLTEVLGRLKDAGLTLNKAKCEFSKTEIPFLGHIIGKDGIKIESKKVEAIKNMPEPTNVHELRRWMGMINQVGKFLDNLATLTAPLRPLLGKNTAWLWGEEQSKALSEIKVKLSYAPVLALYDPNKPIKVNADSSSYGLGAVILQEEGKVWKPIAFASRTLTSTEKRYAQIEKEALALTWACERFQQYLVGIHFEMETDHKPLVPLLGSKSLDELPIRIQRFRMRLLRFTYSIKHVPGKYMYISDALSRAPVSSVTAKDENKSEENEMFVQAIMQSLPATDRRLEQIRLLQHEDPVCQRLIQYCNDHWPESHQLNSSLKPYWQHRGEMTVQDGVLMRGSRIHIPASLRLDILDKLHEGHQGILKCRQRAVQSVWWPGISRDVESMVKQCVVCAKRAKTVPEPLIPSEFPERPWQKVATDLYEQNGTYLLVVDYFSRYIEVAKLSSTTSPAVINHMKSIFARHGIPQTVVSDNGPQYSSKDFREFASDYGFSHVTSSPGHPSGNGEAERAVQTIKNIVASAKDPYAAILAYRSTPLANGYSPAELLMNRKLRTKIPVSPETLKPSIVNHDSLRNREEQNKLKSKKNFDLSHKAHVLPPLEPEDRVWLKDRQEEGIVKNKVHDRSFLITTPSGDLRRNRVDVNKLPDGQVDNNSVPTLDSQDKVDKESASNPVSIPKSTPVKRMTRYGRIVKTPKRYQ